MKTKQQGSLHLTAIIVATVIIFAAVAYTWYHNLQTHDNENNQVKPADSSQVPQQKNTRYTSEKGTDIIVTSPLKDASIDGVVTVRGKVPGNWSFEASFPMELRDDNGEVVASGHAQLETDWMTESLVEFSGKLSYDTRPDTEHGYLVLLKANASGLPKHKDTLKIPITYAN